MSRNKKDTMMINDDFDDENYDSYNNYVWQS